MVLIHIIVLEGLLQNVRIYAKHVPGKSNILSDLLSRQQLRKFHAHSQNKYKMLPTQVDERLWPMEKIWLK